MLLICAGMSRSASTLQYQLAKHLVESKHVGVGIGHHYPHHSYRTDHIFVIKSEQPYSYLVAEAELGRAMCIGIYRDPRDVAVSSMHFFASRHDYNPETLLTGTYGEVILRHLPAAIRWFSVWEPYLSLTLCYEDVYNSESHWVQHLLDIADLLSIPLTAGEATAIYAEHTIDRNIQTQSELTEWLDYKHSMLTRFHVSSRRGVPGTYNDVLELDQIQFIEDQYKEWMQTHGYTLSS